MAMLKHTFSLLLFLITSLCVQAQDDLLKQLESQMKPAQNEPVLATFKGHKIINMMTNETVKKRNLDIRINHLFGNIGKESGGSVHNLYGFDQSQDIRIAAHYGFSDRLMAGWSRSKRNETLEALMKFKVLEQTTNHKIPISITVFGNATATTKSKTLVDKDIHRFTYFGELIVARKFSPKFSLIAAGGYLHRNLVSADDDNDVISLSGGLRLKFTPSASVILDYCHTFGREHLLEKTYDVLGAGIEIETGGHVFSIMFTNASGILENDYLVHTEDSWTKGGIKFSFIISRMFKFGNS